MNQSLPTNPLFWVGSFGLRFVSAWLNFGPLGSMSARISRISLVVFMVLLVLSAFLLSVAGDYWPWYSVMAVFAVAPIFVGPKRYRIFGVIALLLSMFLIFSDVAAGKHLRHQKEQNRARWSSTNAP